MKKSGSIILCILLFAGIFAGCGDTRDAQESTIWIEKKGNIVSLDVDTFDEEYYDEAEVKSEIEATIEAYNEEHGKDAVTLSDFSANAGTGKLLLNYRSAEDYDNFYNDASLYQGKVVNALADGNGFDVEFYRIEDGKVTGTASKQDVYGESEAKVVIIKKRMTNVKVAGNIRYISNEYTEMTGADSVRVDYGKKPEEEDDAVYIIYK